MKIQWQMFQKQKVCHLSNTFNGSMIADQHGVNILGLIKTLRANAMLRRAMIQFLHVFLYVFPVKITNIALLLNAFMFKLLNIMTSAF